VSTIATPRRVEETRLRPSRTFADRLLAAVPLASIYLWLCIVYAFEAWRHVTPWLFTDELETTQISRSLAATGHAARRGEPAIACGGHAQRLDRANEPNVLPLFLGQEVGAAVR